MFITDDPLADFRRHDAEQHREVQKLPVCCYCDEPVQDDYYYDINGEVVCECCLYRFFQKEVSDYVG